MKHDLERELNNKRIVSNQKAAKQDAYQQYLINRNIRMQQKKNGKMKDALEEKLGAVVENFVPKWCHSVAKFCLPPKWYSVIVSSVLNIIYGKKQKDLLVKRLMDGRISMWLYFRWIVASIIYGITFKWMMWLKGRFDTLGVGTKMRKLPNGNVKFIIKYWFKQVDELKVMP